MNTNWRTNELTQLAEAIAVCSTIDEVESFLRDLLTEAEIKEFAGRLAVAKALASGISQRTASKQTGVSIATVTRVNKWLTNGASGYKNVINKIFHHHHKA